MPKPHLLLAGSVLLPAIASAQLGPLTGDVQVNTYATSSQLVASVAANPTTGAFVVVWQSFIQDGSGDGVFAQRFASDGNPTGGEFQVNSYTTNEQSSSAVGVNPSSGDFVVAWHSNGQDGSSRGLFAQRFASDGSATGTEFQVNSFTTSNQRIPAVGVDPTSGSFVVAWQSDAQDGSNEGVFAQRFASDGSPTGSEFQVNSYTNSDQGNPAVGVDPSSGTFVIAWQSKGYGVNYGVFAQRFASDGSATGTEFHVNSYTNSNQRNPELGVDPSNGDFVVAWQSNGQDGNDEGVFAQRFASDGSATGTEFQVNSFTSSFQTRPAVAVDPSSGDFVVAWQSDSQDGSDYGVFAQRFASDGTPSGTEFRVNEFALATQSGASISPRGAGEFAIAWHDFSGQDGCVTANEGVFAQRFASDGTATGTEFQVNTYTNSYQRYPVVGVDPGGNFVVAWQSYSQDASAAGVFAQRFASDGTATGNEFQVNSYTTAQQRFAAIGVDPSSGDFVVAWNSHNQDISGYGVFGQRFGSDGTATGNEFQINSYTNSSQNHPAVGMDPTSGTFVVAWQSVQDGNAYGIFGQRFGSDGAVTGSEFQINSYTTSDQRFPALGVDPNSGAFVVAWQSEGQDGFNYGVFAQRFASDGTPAGSEFQVNSYTNADQLDPAVGVDPNGSFVVAWHSYTQDGSDYGVFAQRFASSGSASGTEFQVNSHTTSYQTNPALGVDPGNGDFVIAWNSNGQDGSNYGVFAQRFASDGSASGTEDQVNSYANQRQSFPAVGVDPNGSFVIAWQSESQDGCNPSTGAGVFVRRFAEVAATPTNTTTATATATATPTSGTSAACPISPAMGCAVPTKGKLIIKDNADDTKDKLVWKFGKGPLLVQADFGNPVTTNGYAFCVYDDGTLKIDLTIPAGMPWETLSTKGYQYKDKNGANDSVTKVKLVGGNAGKSKLQVKGKGAGLAVPMPVSGTQLLSATSSVVAQLHGNGTCWETSFTTGHTHKVNSYKGKF